MAKLEQNMSFQTIAEDNFSGSSELLHKLNRFFVAEFSNLNFSDDELKVARDKFKSFRGIQKFLNTVFGFESTAERYTFLTQFAADFQNKIVKITNHLKDEIGDCSKFLSISNSFTLQSVLQRLHSEKDFEIVISESRPMNEGRIMASRLAEIGIAVTICTEAQIPHSLESCECALVGADAILPDKSVVNKTGSRLIALCCSKFEKPFYVVSDSDKLSDTSDFDPRFADASEIWETNNSSILINNYYFEKVESNLITKIITD